MKKQRCLHILEQIEVHRLSFTIYLEKDVPVLFPAGSTPPEDDPPTYAWAYEDSACGIENIYLGYSSKEETLKAIQDYAYEYNCE